MRMCADAFVLDSSSMGAPGVDEVRWLLPVRPDDELSLRATVLDTRASKSRPDMGFVRFEFELFNAAGQRVMTLTTSLMMGRRERARIMKFWEDIAVGERAEVGRYTFTADDIKAFARRFDPQPFHLDEAAAARSHFGALCASGWHTASVWMRLMVEHQQPRGRRAPRRAASRSPTLGPSPGFRELKWLKPVYVGDTITYSTEVIEKRASNSRPGWGLMSIRNSGVNQKGEPVISFISVGLRRAAARAPHERGNRSRVRPRRPHGRQQGRRAPRASASPAARMRCTTATPI